MVFMSQIFLVFLGKSLENRVNTSNPSDLSYVDFHGLRLRESFVNTQTFLITLHSRALIKKTLLIKKSQFHELIHYFFLFFHWKNLLFTFWPQYNIFSFCLIKGHFFKSNGFLLMKVRYYYISK